MLRDKLKRFGRRLMVFSVSNPLLKFFYLILCLMALWYFVPSTTRTNYIALAERWELPFANGMDKAITIIFIVLALCRGKTRLLRAIQVGVFCFSVLLAMIAMELKNISEKENQFLNDPIIHNLSQQRDNLYNEKMKLIEQKSTVEKTVILQTEERLLTGARGARLRAESLIDEIGSLNFKINDIEIRIRERQNLLKGKGTRLQESAANLFFLSPGGALMMMWLLNIFYSIINDSGIYVALKVVTYLYPWFCIPADRMFNRKRKKRYTKRELEKILNEIRSKWSIGSTEVDMMTRGLTVGQDVWTKYRKPLPYRVKAKTIINIYINNPMEFHRIIGIVAAEKLGLDQAIPRSTVTTIINKEIPPQVKNTLLNGDGNNGGRN